MKLKMLLMLVIGTVFALHSAAQTNTIRNMNKKQIRKWFHDQQWLAGWKVSPHKSIDKEAFARQYQLNKEGWDKAFAFLKNHDLRALASGRHEIDGDNVYASVTENPSRDWDSTNWESHQKYIDLQYVIEGEERIGVHPVSQSTLVKPYDPKKDVANYTAEGKLYRATPYKFFLFFPGDAHRPNITPGSHLVVKKIVIKILMKS